MEDIDMNVDSIGILRDDMMREAADSSCELANRGPVNFALKWLNFYITTEGSCVAVYDEQNLTPIASRKLLNSQTLHGLRAVPNTSTDAGTELQSEFLAFGGRFFTRVTFRIEIETMLVDIIYNSPVYALGDWIWDLRTFMDGSQAALLSHNQMVYFNRQDQLPFSGECGPDTIEYRLCAVQCILYSGQIIGSRPDKLKVAAGTVFNEILIWDAQTGQVFHVLKGHQGVIFSVNVYLNQGLIVSTSDDRSARIYRIEKGSFGGTNENLSEATIMHVAALYGHGSRVWRAALMQKNLVTVGEDGFLCLWDSFSGKLLGRRQVPGGGSVSSLLVSGDQVILGGIAGSLSVINIKSVTLTGFPKDSTWTMPLVPKLGAVKCISIDRGKVVVSTTSGNYLLSQLGTELHNWEHNFYFKECEDYNVVGQHSGFLFTANKHGSVASFAVADQLVIWDRQRMHEGRIYSLICFGNPFSGYTQVLSTGFSGNMFVMRFCNRQKSLIKIKSLVLPIGSERCATCALQISMHRILVGDRQGNIFLYSLDRSARNTVLSSLFNLHGKYGTTDLKRDSEDRILSSGRDGKVYELALQNDSLLCLRVFWQHPTIEWIGRILPYKDRLLLACYQSGDFLLHDVESDYTLLSMATGGGHRAWDCGIDNDRFYYARAYKNSVLVDSVSVDERLAHVLKAPVHTKKINCTATLWHLDDRDVVVTGGEGNLLLISVISSFRVIRPAVRLYGHISSVKCVAVCDFFTDKLLVSVGGRGQLIVWWVNSDLSVKMMDKNFIWNTDRTEDKRKPWKNTSNKVKNEALTRYMSVTVRPEGNMKKTPRFHIIAVGSDTIIRLFSYSIGESIEPTTTVDGGEFCQLQTRWLSETTFLAAATDGLLKLYNVTQNKLVTPTTTSTAALEASSSTDTTENSTTSAAATPPSVSVKYMGSASAHQSGVNALDVRGSLVATGGDDNAITLSRITHSGSVTAVEVICRVVNAHATQITGVLWVGDYHLLSTSIDQRVTLWKLLDGKSLEPQWTKMTAVADVAGFTLFAENRYVLIVGQGLEVISVTEGGSEAL
ncbi:WD repeat-containing protein 6-like isoform X1 [Varroa jacobsoni]|uniref:WD repeat-containing protein 6-like isoform X1 n=1 Tax=Varroa jacobsoni TaxID=62625 RepID=UPI000BF385B6|nr:WD repeat-containing protein 6-like isoform X1 [Varroa jacobsoni]